MSSFAGDITVRLSLVEDLPTIPSIIIELERILHEDTVSAEEVALVIEEDPAIAASVLRVANSVMFYSSTTGTIASIRDAIVRLGFKEVHRIVSAAAFIRKFRKLARRVDPKHFWRQSLATAVAGRVITRYATQRASVYEEETYLAGLLHDIGLLVLDQYFADEYDQIESALGNQDGDWVRTERAVLGLDHGQIGGYVLGRWNLPEVLVQAVTWHNQPENAAPEAQLTAETVQLAELVAAVVGAGDDSPEPMQNLLTHPLWTKLGIAPETTKAVIDDTRNQCTPTYELG